MIPHEFIIYSVCIYKNTSNASYEIILLLLNQNSNKFIHTDMEIADIPEYKIFIILLFAKKSIISSNVCYLLLEESHWQLRFYTMDSLYDEPSTVILFYIGFMFSKFKRHRTIKLTFFICD